MSEIRVPSLDATEPLGFLASLGLLRLVVDLQPKTTPRIRFERDGIAVLDAPGLCDLSHLATLVGDHLAAVVGGGRSFGLLGEPWGEPFSGTMGPDKAYAAEVRQRLCDAGAEGGPAAVEREWLRALSSEVRWPVKAKGGKGGLAETAAEGDRESDLDEDGDGLVDREGEDGTSRKTKRADPDCHHAPALMMGRQCHLAERARVFAGAVVARMEQEPDVVERLLSGYPRLRRAGTPKEAAVPWGGTGWDRSVTTMPVLNPVASGVAVLHEWLAFFAFPLFAMESDGVTAEASCWYDLRSDKRVLQRWFIWPLWSPLLSVPAVRHLLGENLAVALSDGAPVVSVWPHADIHALRASQRTKMRKGDKGNDPFMDAPISVRHRGTAALRALR